MKIQRIDIENGRRKVIKFSEVVESLEGTNKGIINRTILNYKLLSNKTIKTDRYEFSRIAE